MPNILHEVVIESASDKVYKAITEQDGLKSWWTTDSKAEPKVGSVAEFGFYGGSVVFKLQIDKLDTNKSVNWSVQGGGPPDWANTRVTWDLSAAENGTKVVLGHRDFASEDGSYANSNYNWGWFLTSLKAYVETGKGTPYSD